MCDVQLLLYKLKDRERERERDRESIRVRMIERGENIRLRRIETERVLE